MAERRGGGYRGSTHRREHQDGIYSGVGSQGEGVGEGGSGSHVCAGEGRQIWSVGRQPLR